MHDATGPQERLASQENITRTIADSGCVVTSPLKGSSSCRRSCSFIAAEGWTYGMDAPFCDAPALPGSSYCERHRALCEIAPRSPAGLAAARALTRDADAAPPPPADLAFLAASAPPEIEAEAEPQDIAPASIFPGKTAATGRHEDGQATARKAPEGTTRRVRPYRRALAPRRCRARGAEHRR